MAALPSKVWLALYMRMGAEPGTRKDINELGRALVLNYFLDIMEGDQFLTAEELESLASMREVNVPDYSADELAELVKAFRNMGQDPEGNLDPSSMAYFVNGVPDLAEVNSPLSA
jgi:hypothetical protein